MEQVTNTRLELMDLKDHLIQKWVDNTAQLSGLKSVRILRQRSQKFPLFSSTPCSFILDKLPLLLQLSQQVDTWLLCTWAYLSS